MLNRIRVVTMLMMVLVISHFFSLLLAASFLVVKTERDSFAASNDLRMQQSELTTTGI